MGGKRKPPNHCMGCAHFYGAYRDNKCCNYLFDTGHRRPCPPGAACTVREKATKKRKGRGFTEIL